MQDQDFLAKVASDISKALYAGGYRNIEYYDENIVKMNGPKGENIDGEPRIARMFKPVSDEHIIITLSQKDNNKYEIIVTLEKGDDFLKFDREVGDKLKKLARVWGNQLGYTLHTWGREIRSKSDIKRQIKGQNGVEDTMDNPLSEASVKMTGTTRSSYQRIGECKVIIRHSSKVNEEKFGSRSRNIDAIFIETKLGERFRVAENNLHGARAMARHLSNGGSPFDTVGSKITEMMSEMKELRKMVNEARSIGRKKELTEKQSEFVSQIRNRYVKLRETLKKMSGKIGYMRHSVAESFELPSDRMFGAGPHAGKGHVGAALPVTGQKKKVSQADVVAHINKNPRKYGIEGHMRLDTEYWDKPEFDAYKKAKADLERLNEGTVRDADVVAHINKNPRKYGIEGHMRPDTEYWGDREFAAFRKAKSDLSNVNESIKANKENTKVKTQKKAEEKKSGDRADQKPVFDRPTTGKTRLSRDPYSLFSVNEETGVAPEEIVLENWFNEASRVEFFGEEELLPEDNTPKTLKVLPENALGMLNLYQNHPLFDYYMKLYEEQEILDDVLGLVEENSDLWNRIVEEREQIKEFVNYGMDAMSLGRNEHPSDENEEPTSYDDALNKVRTLISDRKLSLENAINKVAKEMCESTPTEEDKEFDSVVKNLWGMAQDAGLVKHDFGSTFSDNVLAPDETIEAHNAEIDAEEFYGDAMFAEADYDDDIPVGAEEVDVQNYCAECGEPFFVDENGIAHHGIDGEIDYDADEDHVPYELESEYDDGMDGDAESALASAGWGTDEDYGRYSDDDMFEEINRVRINAGLPPLVREEKKTCSCGCEIGKCKCGPDCSCGCHSMKEGDPFARHSKRKLKNPKERMTLINPEDKMSSCKFEEDTDVEEGKARADWTKNREETMLKRLDRAGYGDRVKDHGRNDNEPEDRYAKMAKQFSVPDEETPTKHEFRKMKRHVREEDFDSETTAELSEDGARIIQLARFRK